MDTSIDKNPPVMWQPDRAKTNNLNDFRNRINEKYSLQIDNYADLHKWSCDQYPLFWEDVWSYTGVIHSQPYTEVVDKSKNISEIPEWFHGARLNFTENLLRCDDDRTAIFATGEGQAGIIKKSFRELRRTVAVFAAAMKKLGIQKGDRVVGYIPNCCEAIEAMLAAASIGAVWSSTSPDFGVNGVLERFSQIQPRMIFSVNAVRYNGRVHNHLDKLEQVVRGLPELEKVVVIPFVESASMDISQIPNSDSLSEFLSLGQACDGELTFEQLPFNHPLFIMYSSGTTGVPKCMVHSAGGTLLKHLQEHIIQSSMTKDDVILYYTTAGWMMWNWLISALAAGSALVLYDGSPLIPNANVLWDLVDNVGITMLGTGAKWLSVLEEKGATPRTTHNLSTLKIIMSTGSPLKPQTYDYVYRDIKDNLLLASISGGTDIIACFMGQNWTVPVYRGEIQTNHLGCAMECWSEEGKIVYDERGELICTKPFPSMPVYFWNDPGGLKYKKAYFAKYPAKAAQPYLSGVAEVGHSTSGVWAHGDYCMFNPRTGGILMLGRSDGTLNPSGVRFGSAEIYNIVESFKEIEDSMCVSQRSADASDERVILFLKMSPNIDFNNDLVNSLKASIRKSLSARHVPAIILPTKDIPYTISGKKVEVAVRQAIMGQDVQQRGALANPQSLDAYYNIPELAGF